MDKEEKEYRLRLKKFRWIATWLQNSENVKVEAFGKQPRLQADVVLNDITGSYGFALEVIREIERGAGRHFLSPFLSDKDALRELKSYFGPIEITRFFTMPMLKLKLERLECGMIELGYRLPKWKRPPWLSEVKSLL
jgi:hypothetical protein